MMAIRRLKIERRLEVSRTWQALAILIAIGASLVVSALLLRSAGADVMVAFSHIYAGAFGTWDATIETMVKATPLILTGAAVTVAFRAKFWNIGAEGQLFAGAMMAYWFSTFLGWMPAIPLFIAILGAGFLGGALYGGLAGILKTRFGVNEVLSTVMLNYVTTYFMSYMLTEGPWRDPSSFYQQTPRLAEAAHFPLLLSDTRLHAGFAVALIAVVVIHVLLTRTSLGYEIRAIGANPVAAKFKGIRVNRTVLLVILISGGLAGLAGTSEVFGLHYRLRPDISVGFGFTGIIIAMLAGLRPAWVVVAAIFFGALLNGSVRMQIFTKVPVALISTMEAIVLLFFLTAAFFSRYEIKVIKSDG
jgi:simple sugar transport system permease protein